MLSLLSSDAELREYWSLRYRTRELLRGEALRCRLDFAARVVAGLPRTQDQRVVQLLTPAVKSWARPAAGFALAASVAVVTLITAAWVVQDPASPVPPVAESVPPAVAPPTPRMQVAAEQEMVEGDEDKVLHREELMLPEPVKGTRLVDYENPR